MLEDFLFSQNYDVCGSARGVAEAVRLANEHKPDLAIMDYRLAHGEYGSHIRPLLDDKTTMGILYVSGDPLENTLTAVDGDAYLQKPYGLQELCCALQVIHEMKCGSPSALPLPKGMVILQKPAPKAWQPA